ECEQDSLDMQTLYGADRRRIDVVPCGFDPEELWPVSSGARLKLGLPENEFIILQLGRIVRRKGIDNVIRAAGELRRRHGIASRLLVVGGNSPIPDLAGTPEFARLVAVAEEAGVRQNVSFVGQRPRTELRYFYSAADVFVTTPWYEPFGITPVEAMACDTAVIGSAVGGIKTTVLDGRTGYLVPPDDPAALADRLAKLHRDPALACRLASAGMHRAYRYFTWRKVTAQLATIYRAVLKGKPARRAVPAVVGAGVPLASRI
ncbi:MAG: glycosyltransferase, partial [Burkholderiaceae bacterium]|nr:glycosyltransferase [Burkholderiaceae bacterium]